MAEEWILVPCMIWSPPGAQWAATCFMTEGDEYSVTHTHFLSKSTGVEKIATHPPGQCPAVPSFGDSFIRNH